MRYRSFSYIRWMEPRFSTESPYVWIADAYHPHYPNYVKILEVLSDKRYKVEITLWPRPHSQEEPIIDILKEDQLSDDLIGG